MGKAVMLPWILGALAVLSVPLVKAEDPYFYYTWTVSYGTRSVLGISQQVILINDQFPGPKLEAVTNNIILNLINKLDQPFLLTWNDIKQRKNSWQDGVLGTNCPIPPNSYYTYKFQAKDQIGSFRCFPSTLLHKAAGGFGALNIYHRSVIPIPYANPDGDFTLLIGKPLPFPDGVLINVQTQTNFSGEQGKTYMFRISNVGLSTSLNCSCFSDLESATKELPHCRIDKIYQDHSYSNCGIALRKLANPVSGPLPAAPAFEFHCQCSKQEHLARSNPQGSLHYGKITPTKTIVLSNSASLINGKLCYTVNGVSYVNPDTPPKLADHYNIPGVFTIDSIQTLPSGGAATVATSFMPVSYKIFSKSSSRTTKIACNLGILMVMIFGLWGESHCPWTPHKRKTYNLVDALTRHTTQVYPNSWTPILISMDNQCNLSLTNEYDVPSNVLLCGKAVGIRP
ncbi:SKU5 similar 17 isoform 3 [Hibiscus syriacus]|uniref:SKU5 similar 17 isoform 3 n=1 Tax=Hibiscus syriacus TaxID=106335 RepID=A0A6A2Y1B6_HIBSY|nr:SKU5 similar 17 isoform 3 [Hibiscus syriacus]